MTIRRSTVLNEHSSHELFLFVPFSTSSPRGPMTNEQLYNSSRYQYDESQICASIESWNINKRNKGALVLLPFCDKVMQCARPFKYP